VLSGQQAPGAASGVIFTGINGQTFDFNDSGVVAFNSTTNDGLYRSGIWSGLAESLSLVARQDTLAPGVSPTINFGSMTGGISLNDAGQVAFVGSIATSGFNTGIWSNASGSLQLVALAGRPLPPGTINDTFANFYFEPQLDNAGKVEFTTTTRFGDSTLWRGDANGLAMLASTQMQAPDMPPGTQFYARAGFEMASNKSGQVLIRAAVANPGLGTTGAGMWSVVSGALALVIGVAAPTDIPGVTYNPTNTDPRFELNDHGEIAVLANLSGTGVTSRNDSAVIVKHLASTEIVAREGDEAPGTAPGTAFQSFFTAPNFNESGAVTFAAQVNSAAANDTGLWAGTADNLKLIAREGDTAPGAAGAAFIGFSYLNVSAFNDLGETAFVAQLQGDGITSANDFGIWATDPFGQLRLIVREGDTMEVAPNDFRVVSTLAYGGAGFPYLPKMNNSGQIAFYAEFTNGRGIVISNAVAVPEAACVLMLAVCAFCVCATRRTVRR
jgi:hypothetical protein